MEKLQAALAKARAARHEATETVRPGPVLRDQHVRKPSKSNTTETIWEALPRFDLSPAVLRQHRIIAGEANSDATPFDLLRTKIILQMEQNGWSRLAITSPEPSCGKTTLACNLALGLGRHTSSRTMLFDLDLGSPSVHEFFDLKMRYGLPEVLTDMIAFEKQAVRVTDNVAVSISPHPEKDPTRFLMMDRTAEFLDDIQRDYAPDIMIFDLPSALSSDKALAFLKNVDCALIVARAEYTKFKKLDRTEIEVAANTNVLGVALNGCRRGTLSDSDLS
ncbi:CpsD/CapB family tyrosine-protein kinase (plasmid) [Ruegeria sp. SCSIO 43209]|uniref:CpsD/CapB family tyrosine-protein kinase n=1 Tax=Ruegeria sp. SCSIO 43209 TaxID=2793010 RepID=UPI00148007B6|nr:CpsD/CapB family tyrosine-protein kinase [Ruegeria sp. SCSIO 43209]UAB91742.1 CpsD/CapB family tyrosine-protein kinase [Ruegeria sp. SCSIO 43209]